LETIIGLGNAGCRIAASFSQHSQYDVYGIDSAHHKMSKFKQIPLQNSHEEYESFCPSLEYFLKDAKPPYLFIIAGGGTISGSVLRILEQLNSRDIYILYIKPDASLISDKKGIQDKITFQVLQQYARSDVFRRLFIISNPMVEKILGGIPITTYYEKINDLIVNTVHMTNVYDNIDSIMNTFSDPIPTAKISTFGILNVDSGERKLFYPLEYTREYKFYYSFCEKQLEIDSQLLATTLEQVKSSISENTKASYGIYSNDYEQNYGYVIASATMIQEENF